MAEFLRRDPVGVDVTINKIQRDLFFDLTERGFTHYDAFPRIYLVDDGKNKTPMNFFDDEYKGVLFNDKMTVNSYFIADKERTFDPKELIYKHDVSLIFQAQLNKIKLFGEDKSRKDEAFINEIRLSIKKRNWEKRLTGIVTGVENVFSKFKINYDKMNLNDIGTFCIVRFDFELLYDNTIKSNPVR
jgi:hypothetical protein